MVGDHGGEDRGHVNVFWREGTAGDLAEQPGFRERHQGLGDADVDRQRPVIGAPGWQAKRFAPADADAGRAGSRELFHRCFGMLPAEHGGQQARRVDAVREFRRRRCDREQNEHVAPFVLARQRPEVAEAVGSDRLAQRVQLADEVIPEPAHFSSVAANRAEQQRLTAIGEGGVFDGSGVLIRLDRQGEDPVGHLDPQHPAAGGDVRHQVSWV
jgi:hypothetical protein